MKSPIPTQGAPTRPPMTVQRAGATVVDLRFASEDDKQAAVEFVRLREDLTSVQAAAAVERLDTPSLVYLELQLKAASAERGHSSEYDPFAGVW